MLSTSELPPHSERRLSPTYSTRRRTPYRLIRGSPSSIPPTKSMADTLSIVPSRIGRLDVRLDSPSGGELAD